ncbi:phosphoribosylanthranilate isomerase [Hyphobacterium sp.]|uniref:phosphoribosylanthranilate isomerase n=1 Tax=Hyphobacterium sp. TaxID=2004662 RepID=UPI003B52FA6B
MTDIKFCGLRTQDDVLQAARLGARWAGFVHFAPSPRHIEPDHAAEFFRAAKGNLESVSVTVNADLALLEEIARSLAPDWIQLHGNETPEQVIAARGFARNGIIKALPVAEAADLEAAAAFDGVADMILFDARPPAGADRPGGWGEKYDYALLKQLNIDTPWLLSGGLTADNVRAAVAVSGAFAVDVSSGIERAPGDKSENRMKAFTDALTEQS